MDLSSYRKFVVAALAAGVTLGNAFGVPGLEELSVKAVAVFDAIAALLVYQIPNAR